MAAGADIEGWPPGRDEFHDRAMNLLQERSVFKQDVCGRNMDLSFEVTPLMQAAKGGKAMAVALLLDARAAPQTQNKYGMQALHFAATVGCCDSCRYLIAARASPNARDMRDRDAFACLPIYCA